jgi:2,4-dienoyl-CoA reductase-like NADH-dependent reductase (Old Yellow Enzyme family)
VESILFSPIPIGTTLVFPNRFIRAATHEAMMTADGMVTEPLIRYYRELAKGNIGLIITGFAYVHRSGQSALKQGAIADDRFIAGYRRLTEVVHAEGGRCALQIVHGGRQSSPELIGGIPMAPSVVKDTWANVTPREMTVADIETAIDAFVQAAQRAHAAGFDAVELHAAHGYLLSEFISPYTNRRQDAWGGSTERRCKIIVHIIEGIKDLVGTDFPLLVKLNSEDGVPGGLTIEESVKVARVLDAAGIDAIEVSGGIREAQGFSSRKDISTIEEEGYFVPAAAKIKAAVGVPVAVVGGLRSLSLMEEIIVSGKADLISMSRPFINEPDIVLKFQRGETAKSECLSCNLCYNPEGIRCAETNKNLA